jgi:dipeptidyl aminopeptidase/acylaminoacyl peptidase
VSQQGIVILCFAACSNKALRRNQTPLFIAHGRYDRQVPPEQSAKMRDTMEKQGMEVKILWLAEGHIFQNEENLIAYYEAVDGFLKKHLH